MILTPPLRLCTQTAWLRHQILLVMRGVLATPQFSPTCSTGFQLDTWLPELLSMPALLLHLCVRSLYCDLQLIRRATSRLWYQSPPKWGQHKLAHHDAKARSVQQRCVAHHCWRARRASSWRRARPPACTPGGTRAGSARRESARPCPGRPPPARTACRCGTGCRQQALYLEFRLQGSMVLKSGLDISMGQTLKSLWNAAALFVHPASEGSPHSQSKLRLHQQGTGYGVAGYFSKRESCTRTGIQATLTRQSCQRPRDPQLLPASCTGQISAPGTACDRSGRSCP